MSPVGKYSQYAYRSLQVVKKVNSNEYEIVGQLTKT